MQTKTIAVDFNKEDVYDVIRSGLGDLDIGVLVNNVGGSYPYPEYFDMVDYEPDVNIELRYVLTDIY